MKKYMLVLITLLLLFLVGCGSANNLKAAEKNMNKGKKTKIHAKLDNFKVKKTNDVIEKGDFIFRLVSEKEQYNKGEDVKLYGEIEYIGEKDSVTIFHSSSAILFQLKEETRGFDIGFAVNDIGLTTTIQKGEPYRENYVKSGGYSADDPKDFVKFMKDFLDRDDFPSGYYVVLGETDFIVIDENSEIGEKINIQATFDFKVFE